MKRPAIIILGTIAAILLIIAGIDYFTFNPPPDEKPAPVNTTSETKPVPAPEESKKQTAPPATSFEQKVETLREAAADVIATGESREVTIVITEAEANAQAAKLLPQADIPEDIPLEIKGIILDFQADNTLLTNIKAVIYGFAGEIEVKSHISVEEGEPVVKVTDISVPLPGIKDKVTELIEQKTGDLIDELTRALVGDSDKVDLEYKEIITQEEKATITTIIKPKA